MTFNISDFKSTVDKWGGPARTNLFEVIFSNVPKAPRSAMTLQDLTFFCQTATLPGINFNVTPYEAVAALPKNFVTGMASEPINTTFMCDSSHQLVSFFHAWAQRVVNYGTQGGAFSEVNGRLPYEIAYKSEYTCRMTIKHYSTQGDTSKYYEVILDGVFPTAIGEVGLSWAENDSYATLPVSFSYDRIQFMGEKIGSATSALNRGNGLYDLLTAVGRFQQATTFGNFPRGVSSAIDQLIRFDNAVDAVNRLFN